MAKKKPPRTEKKPHAEKLPAAVELGHRGGVVGGPARARKLSSQVRKKIATDAANARWRGQRKKKAD